MLIARIRVNRNALEVEPCTGVTQGLTGAAVLFEGFGAEWAGLSKTAVFRTGHAARDVAAILEGEPVVIPWELLETPGARLMVGICGSSGDGSVVIASEWGQLGEIAPGATPVGRPAEPPTPDWTQRLESRVNGALEKAMEAAPLADQAAESEKKAAHWADRALSASQQALTASEAAGASAEQAASSAAAASVSAERAAAHGITGAVPGDLMQITRVDGAGVPTALRPVSPGELEGRWELLERLEVRKEAPVTRFYAFDLRGCLLKINAPKASDRQLQASLYGQNWTDPVAGWTVNLRDAPYWYGKASASGGRLFTESGCAARDTDDYRITTANRVRDFPAAAVPMGAVAVGTAGNGVPAGTVVEIWGMR